MTDEEKLAEEWADKNITLATSRYNPQAESIAKRAFLAGLKAGREMTKEEICNLYHYDCECCPYEIDQKDEEGNIVLDCSYEEEIKEK